MLPLPPVPETVRSAFQSRPLQIFLIAAAILAFVWFTARKAGMQKAAELQSKYPDNGNGIPKGFDAKPYALELYKVMSGLFTLSGTKELVFRKVLNLPTDDMLIAVNNTFNNLYLSKGKGTLVDWIEDEFYTDWTTKTKDRLLARLRAAGAKSS